MGFTGYLIKMLLIVSDTQRIIIYNIIDNNIIYTAFGNNNLSIVVFTQNNLCNIISNANKDT
jgi:hypothetical protein